MTPQEIQAAVRAEVAMFDLDPRWEWMEIHTMGQAGPEYIRGPCRHIDVVPVDSVVTGEILARLCLTCDTQLPYP